MKLYEIIGRKLGFIKEPDIISYNPLNIKIGAAISINMLDYRSFNFIVNDILEYNVNDIKFYDYVLKGSRLDKDIDLKLRVLDNKVLALNLYDEFIYNPDFKKNVLENESKVFHVDDDKDDNDPSNDTSDDYWRVKNVGVSYFGKQKSLKDNSIVEVEFWDYSRITELDGVKLEQFLIVEMNTNNGYFQIWRGEEVPLEGVKT